MSNEYALKEGSLVVLPSPDEERRQLSSIEEAFDVETLEWGTADELPAGEKFDVLLYKLFLHLFRVSRSEHRTLLESYGFRAGAMLSHALGGNNPGETLRVAADEMEKRGIASARSIAIRRTRTRVLVMERCLGSIDHPTYACFFLEGFVRGLVQAKHGTGQRVERLSIDLPGCCLVVGRPRHSEMEALKEAVLHQPLRVEGGGRE